MTLYIRHGNIAVAMDIHVFDDTVQAEKGEPGEIARYVLSGDLLAGRVVTKLASDGSGKTVRSYYHLDHQNSTRLVSDETGATELRYEYRAFGEQLRRLNAVGSNVDDLARYSYGGKELDDDTNLYYFNARYYDATTGRFINVDPIQDGTNWYVYCNNNPLKFVDPTGLEMAKTDDMHQQDAPDSLNLGTSDVKIDSAGCVLTAYTKGANAIWRDTIKVQY